MPYPSYPFLADAQGAGVASGQTTNVNVETFAFVMQGVIAAGSAQTSSLAQSPSGFPQPEAMAGTYTSATGGNTNIGSTGFIEYASPGNAFQASNSFASTSNPFTNTFPAPPQYGNEQSTFSAAPPLSASAGSSSPMPNGGNSASADLNATSIGSDSQSAGTASVIAIEDSFSAVNAAVSAGVA